MKHREAPDFPPSFLPEAVKKLGYGERRDFTHVQGPKKFACQNDAVLSLLLTGASTSVRSEGQSICIYMVLLQVAGVSSRKTRYPLMTIPVPPILVRLRRTNFSDPWTTGKADFAVRLNLFTSSPHWRE